jgi:phosphatidylinositol dimannoside acyltransferase
VKNKQLAMYRAGTMIASALPCVVACRLGQGVGWLVGQLPDYDGRRAVVGSHMGRVLGRRLSHLEERRMVADVFANFGRYWAESLRLPTLSHPEVAAGIAMVGFEHVESALAGGKGVIIAAPHLGGWEWGAMYLAGAGMPVTVAVEPLEPPERFEWFARFREALGMQVVAVGPGAAPAILQALRDNHIVCLLSDRLVGPTAGVEVSFFGARAKLPAGPVTLAVRSGAPLMAAAIYYGRPAISHTIVFRPPLELAPHERFRSTVEAGAQALANEMEQLIREAPSQWHITQPNWPGDPELHSPWAWSWLTGRDNAAGDERAGHKRAGDKRAGDKRAGDKRAGGDKKGGAA